MAVQSVLDEAREYLNAWRSLPYPEAIAPSELWRNHIAMQLEPILQTVKLPETVVEHVTGQNITTDPLATDKPLFKQVSGDYLEWLEKFGYPLESFPPTVQESVLAAPSVVAMHRGRRYSTAFLYHLGIAANIQKFVGQFESVLEIGAGHGGLPRLMKLLNPSAKFVLIDLPETLFLCYVFLRAHFPNCTFEAVVDQDQLKKSARSADFTFVPAQLAGTLAGSSFDLAINTASLSEMTQTAADWYLNLIENETKVKHFCHLNRFGTPETFLGDACGTSFGLDPNWEVLSWRWRGKQNFTNLHPEWPPLLNLILRRIPKQVRSKVLSDGMAGSLRTSLATTPEKSDEWYVGMWDLIRLGRKHSDIDNYLKIIRADSWRETPYYEALRAKVT